ncbi:efflux RND transporter periplasmic adaptor subunit [Solilutibacter silvestris]|uniref:RND efflux transport protein n=1 Tax=Solilutibacter silvestris TaxID=1645665 RepID=A0A2K1PZR9_9GAMM|nr:efflux RND transporter periplasmic adaptor subunit [Lysobacter silvestris]PNS08157.1 RND efflux transport protein [Lysobacter silvestris]
MKTTTRLLALSVLSTALIACSSKQGGGPGQGGQMPPPEVGFVVVQPSTIAVEAQSSGRLAAYRSSDVRARVAGVVQRRIYTEGSDVKVGQPMFQIDPEPLRAATAAAQAALASAQATSANAHAAAERARGLAPGKFISRADLDNAVAAERSANAAVKQAQAAVQSARINEGYASVHAPIAGRAGIAQVTEGALVGQGTATLLTTVDQVDPLYIEFSVGVNDLTKLRELSAQGGGSREVDVILPDGSMFDQKARLDFSGSVVDPATGAVKLRALLPNPQHLLMPGTFVTVKATLAEQQGAYRIPQIAILRDQQGPYVLVVGSDDKAARKSLPDGRQQGSNYIVSGGLAPGDKVIVSGVQRVQQPGQAVKPVPADAKPAAPAAAAAPAKQG